MGEIPLHDDVVDKFRDVLRWLYHDEGWFIARNYEMYFTTDPSDQPISPDLAVFKGVIEPPDVADLPRRWAVGEGELPPAVVIEIASNKTVSRDLEVKPPKYARIGVREYLFWDPRPSVRPRKRPLRGWRCRNGIAEEMALNEHGWLWSDELESWVVPEGRYIRLYSRDGRLRLTQAQAHRAASEAERAAKEEALARADAERTAKEAERTAKERLLALLRSHGIDPATDGE